MYACKYIYKCKCTQNSYLCFISKLSIIVCSFKSFWEDLNQWLSQKGFPVWKNGTIICCIIVLPFIKSCYSICKLNWQLSDVVCKDSLFFSILLYHPNCDLGECIFIYIYWFSRRFHPIRLTIEENKRFNFREVLAIHGFNQCQHYKQGEEEMWKRERFCFYFKNI